MFQDSKNSSVRLLLAEDVSHSVLSEVLLSRSKRWVQFCVEQEGITQAWIGRVDEKNSTHWMTGWPSDETPDFFSAQMLSEVTRTKKFITFRNHDELISCGLFPLIRANRVIGVLGLLSNDTDYFKPGTLTWVNALSTMISDSLFGRGRAGDETQIEHEISRILQSSLDVRDHLPKVLETLADALKADAVILLGYLMPAKRFELIRTFGVGIPVLAKLRLFFEAGLAEKNSDRHQPVWVDDLQMSPNSHPICRLDEDGFRGYLALPLIGHNDLAGVIEIFWREPQPSQTWDWDLLERVTEQIAFGLQRAGILKDIHRRNEELQSKYNAMVMGLSSALEFRNIETAGHTRRVSQFTIRLVEHMGIPPEEWDSIRQGALLHDIGKLGIPDKILLKPESLTPDERKIMQQHVFYGYNILANFINARHTLDITRYHHERWDGGGYPYGWKGEQIPLVARLFSIIDVYDALKSDRPYRSAWSHEQVLIYIREQAGREFDPHIVKLFLEIADEMV